MSRYTVICHRCGKSTFVDLSKTISDQRCRACRGFLQGVEVHGGSAPELHRKLVWKQAGGAGSEPEWKDQEVPIVPVRSRWPKFFIIVTAVGVGSFLAAIGYGTFNKFRNTLGGHERDYGQLLPDKVDVRLTEEWRKSATALAQRALAAPTIEELLPLLYHPEVSSDYIRQYYLTKEPLPLGKNLDPEYFVPPGDHSENAVAFAFEDTAQRHRHLVVVEKPGGMVVDWPSLTGHGEVSLEEYRKSLTPQTVVVRARARIGQYYNDYFANPGAWLSIRLSDVTDDNVIHGYLSRELAITPKVEAEFPDKLRDKVPAPDVPVIVVLRQPAGNVKPDQTEILSIEDRTWYRSDGLTPIIQHIRAIEKATSPAAPPPSDPPPPNQPAQENPSPAPPP